MRNIRLLLYVILFLVTGVAISSGNSIASAAEGEDIAYKLEPKFLINNFNSEMNAATVTSSPNDFKTIGNFRTSKDFDVMYWEAEDQHSHLNLKYPTNGDFSNVILEYNYKISGDLVPIDGVPSPTLTIITNDDKAYYVRLWNYVTDRPLDNWEQKVGSMLGVNYAFPSNRTAGNASGTEGNIRIDFNELYSGWVPFVQKETDGETSWVPNEDWVKVPVDNIKRIEWSFVPKEYDYAQSETTYFSESKPFGIDFSNWNVYGETFLMNEKAYVPEGDVQISDSYDESYNLTPERIVDEYARLGFGGKVNFNIGSSRFYDKVTQENDSVLIEDHPFNLAFEEWYKSYLENLSSRNTEVISAISMENMDAPATWWQKTWDGQVATTLLSTSPKLLSFTNLEVQNYYKQFILALAKLQSDNNMSPSIQLTKPMWWHLDNLAGSPPTFYDQSTKDLYEQKFGVSMYEFKSVNDPITGHEDMLNWLSEQNGDFSLMLKNTLKESYPTGQYSVLMASPTDKDMKLEQNILGIVNFPVEQWKSPNLDFYTIEDSNYIVANNLKKHLQALTFAQSKLAYSPDKINYMASTDPTNNDAIWRNINQALNDGVNMNYDGVYIWSYSQVKNKGWTQPVIIKSSVPQGMQEEDIIQVSLSGVRSDSLIYTVDGREPDLSTGTTYSEPLTISEDTRLMVKSVKNGVMSNVITMEYLFNKQQYNYDSNNHLEWLTLYQDNQKYKVSFSYDKNGNMTEKKANKILNMWGDQNIIPIMIGDISRDGSIVSASSNFGESYRPYKAFDHLDLEQAWITNGVPDGWIAFKFPNPKHVISYKIYPRNESSAIQASPKSWTFEGYDGSKWVVLSQESGITDWMLKQAKSFNVENSGNYSEYRINITENNGHWYTSVGEIEMVEGDSDGPSDVKLNIIPTMTSNESSNGIATAISEFGSSYAAYKAFDHINSEQSWITNGSVEGWLAFEFPLSTTVRSYKIMPRYDETTIGSAPKSWTFEGYNGSDWQVLSSESNVTDWQVNESKIFNVNNPGKFAKYRINITENNGHTWTSIGELEMMN